MRRLTRALLVLTALVLLLTWSLYSDYSVTSAVAVLDGHSTTGDWIQDIGGFRLLAAGQNPYPAIGAEATALGLDWGVALPSTHPPTAFLFAAPLARFSWPLASALWGWTMLGCLYASLRLLGVRRALPLTLVGLLCPPVVMALGNFPLLILLLTVLAWRARERALVCGALIALASLSKLTPALLLLAPLWLSRSSRERLRLVGGFALVWGLALGWCALLNPAVFGQYLAAQQVATAVTVARADNLAPLPLLARWGVFGLVAGLFMLCAGLYAFRRAAWPTVMIAAVLLSPILWMSGFVGLLAPLTIATHEVSIRGPFVSFTPEKDTSL